MFSTETCFLGRSSASLVLLLFACVGNFVNCSFYDERTGSRYTEATLNITECDGSAKKCRVLPYDDDQAKFGQHSPKHKARGWLYSLMETNVNGCKEFNVMVDRIPWIALIERGECNFEKKINNAKKHNATAVIIYDNKNGDVVTMSHDEAINIVAVSVKKSLGQALARALVNRTKTVFIAISVGKVYEETYQGVNPTSVLFVSVSFIVLMVISLAWLVFYYVQRFRYVHARDKTEKRLTSAAKKAIAKLPTRTVSKKTEDDESDNCAVCLDGYKASDVVRILPCQHEFHKLCIDPWLVEHRTCPMCKLNILKELGVTSDEVRSRDVEVATTEQEDHHTAADNQGVVMNEIEPSVSERRPSSDTSESSSVSGGSGRVLHVSAEVNWEREDQSSSTSNLVDHPNLQA